MENILGGNGQTALQHGNFPGRLLPEKNTADDTTDADDLTQFGTVDELTCRLSSDESLEVYMCGLCFHISVL